MSQRHVYTVELGAIAPGRPFMMVNYTGVYIRVFADKGLTTSHTHSVWGKESPFNDDGHHVPIVELATGYVSYMSKIKPCMVYPGESYR